MVSVSWRIRYVLVGAVFWAVLVVGCSKTGIQSTVNHGAIEGSVRDSYTEQPIPGAIVSVGDTSATVGADGAFRLYNLPEGLLPVEVSRDGYQAYRTSVLIDSDTEFHAFLDSIGRFAHLSGRVYLGQTQITMSGVRISVESRATLSDSLGYYHLDSLRSGIYKLCASLNNHVTCREAMSLKDATTVDIHLEETMLSGRVFHEIDGPVADARVAIAGTVALTDDSGRYEMPHVLRGRHTLYVTHQDYLPTAQLVSLRAQPSTLEVRVKRWMVDTLPISADASVMWSNLEGCQACPEWGGSKDNYGFDHALMLGYYLAPDSSAPGGAWNGVARSVMRLPAKPEHLDSTGIESARLEFHLAEFPSEGTVIALRKVQQDLPWSEASLTWESLPETYHIPLAVYSPTDLTPLELDLTSYYADHRASAVTLVFQADESGTTTEPRVIRIHSRQSEPTGKRPVVLLEYIR